MTRCRLVLALALGAAAIQPAAAQPGVVAPSQPAAEPALQPPRRPSERLVLEPARLEDGKDLRLPPLVIAQERGNKDRAVMWIGGLLVLAAAFLWNRNRRHELERQELAASRREAGASAASTSSEAGAASPPSEPGRPSKEP